MSDLIAQFNADSKLAEYVALAETVLAMRQAQRQYFKTRSQSDLVASKRAGIGG